MDLMAFPTLRKFAAEFSLKVVGLECLYGFSSFVEVVPLLMLVSLLWNGSCGWYVGLDDMDVRFFRLSGLSRIDLGFMVGY